MELAARLLQHAGKWLQAWWQREDARKVVKRWNDPIGLQSEQNY